LKEAKNSPACFSVSHWRQAVVNGKWWNVSSRRASTLALSRRPSGHTSRTLQIGTLARFMMPQVPLCHIRVPSSFSRGQGPLVEAMWPISRPGQSRRPIDLSKAKPSGLDGPAVSGTIFEESDGALACYFHHETKPVGGLKG
jgi:hypothetical protein